jgi:Rieske Fe-S protein
VLRRGFLKVAVKTAFAALTALAIPALFFIYPSKVKKRTLQQVFLMDEDDLPRQGVRRIEFEYKADDRLIAAKAFISATDKGLTVFSSVCTHLGCLVNWDNNKKEFLCPCHGGKYDIYGNVTAGPPPRSLTTLPLEIIDGKVYVVLKL